MSIGPTERKKDSIIRLTPTQGERLTNIAEKLHCRSGSGPTFGMPSWRVMVAGIADGVLVVRNPSDKSDKAERRERKKQRREKKAKAAAIPGAPDWWKPWYGNAMGQEHAIKVSGLTVQEIVALGLRFEFNPFLQHPEVVVGKPEWPAPFLPSRPHWWWKPIDDSTMMVDDAVAASGMTPEQLVAGGLEISECGQWIYAGNWKGWKATAETKPVKLRDSKFPVSEVSPPSWFVPVEKGWPVMMVEDAEAASGYSRGAMEASGMKLQKTHDGKLIVAWPHDPAYVVSGDEGDSCNEQSPSVDTKE